MAKRKQKRIGNKTKSQKMMEASKRELEIKEFGADFCQMRTRHSKPHDYTLNQKKRQRRRRDKREAKRFLQELGG